MPPSSSSSSSTFADSSPPALLSVGAPSGSGGEGDGHGGGHQPVVRILLLGETGAGKSTLVRLLAAELAQRPISYLEARSRRLESIHVNRDGQPLSTTSPVTVDLLSPDTGVRHSLIDTPGLGRADADDAHAGVAQRDGDVVGRILEHIKAAGRIHHILLVARGNAPCVSGSSQSQLAGVLRGWPSACGPIPPSTVVLACSSAGSRRLDAGGVWGPSVWIDADYLQVVDVENSLLVRSDASLKKDAASVADYKDVWQRALRSARDILQFVYHQMNHLEQSVYAPQIIDDRMEEGSSDDECSDSKPCSPASSHELQTAILEPWQSRILLIDVSGADAQYTLEDDPSVEQTVQDSSSLSSSGSALPHPAAHLFACSSSSEADGQEAACSQLSGAAHCTLLQLQCLLRNPKAGAKDIALVLRHPTDIGEGQLAIDNEQGRMRVQVSLSDQQSLSFAYARIDASGASDADVRAQVCALMDEAATRRTCEIVCVMCSGLNAPSAALQSVWRSLRDNSPLTPDGLNTFLLVTDCHEDTCRLQAPLLQPPVDADGGDERLKVVHLQTVGALATTPAAWSQALLAALDRSVALNSAAALDLVHWLCTRRRVPLDRHQHTHGNSNSHSNSNSDADLAASQQAAKVALQQMDLVLAALQAVSNGSLTVAELVASVQAQKRELEAAAAAGLSQHQLPQPIACDPQPAFPLNCPPGPGASDTASSIAH